MASEPTAMDKIIHIQNHCNNPPQKDRGIAPVEAPRPRSPSLWTLRVSEKTKTREIAHNGRTIITIEPGRSIFIEIPIEKFKANFTKYEDYISDTYSFRRFSTKDPEMCEIELTYERNFFDEIHGDGSQSIGNTHLPLYRFFLLLLKGMDKESRDELIILLKENVPLLNNFLYFSLFYENSSRDNIETLQEAIDYANNTIITKPFTPSEDGTSKATLDENEFRRLEAIRAQGQNALRNNLKTLSDDQRALLKDFYFILLQAQEISKSKIGNCGELSFLCAFQLLAQGVDNITFCEIHNHMFLIVGDLIVDPWLKKIVSKNELDDYLSKLAVALGEDVDTLKSYLIDKKYTIKFDNPENLEAIACFIKDFEGLDNLKKFIECQFRSERETSSPNFFTSSGRMSEGVKSLLSATSFGHMQEIAQSQQGQYGNTRNENKLFSIIAQAKDAVTAKGELEQDRIMVSFSRKVLGR